MRKHPIFAIAAAIVMCIASSSFGQRIVPGRVIIRVTPESVSAMRALFSDLRTSDPHFDPQKCASSDEEAIRSLFGLPKSIEHLKAAPLLAQHNVVLESLREHTNPLLFPNNKYGIRAGETESMKLLRSSEDRLARCFELRFDAATSVEQVIVSLKKSYLVEVAEPRYECQPLFIPNDSLLGQQYSISSMHMTRAWDEQRCDSTMLVADADIGTDWQHQDLRNQVFVNAGETGLDSLGFDKRSNGIDDDGDGFIDDWHGWDFAGSDGTAPDNDPSTTADHGTHTAGILAAQGNNVTGICGIAFGAKILVLKCGDDTGGNVAFGYEGMVYAADMGAKVVNNSWGGTGYSQVAQDIVNYTTAKNCLVVAAAGNQPVYQDLYPASYDHVMSVAATDQGDGYAFFSSFSRHVDVCAPGQGVLSTVPFDGYKTLDGSSMASPNAAGVAALVRQKFPELTPDQVTERIRTTARPLIFAHDDPHFDYTGHGLVQADSALDVTVPHHSVRIVGVTIEDADGDHILQSGESANIILSVENYLDPIKKLSAHLELLAPGPDNIQLSNQDIPFPDANTLDVVQNVSGTFHIDVLPTAGHDVVVPFRVTFGNGSDYQGDVDYFTLILNPSYLDLNKNNVTVTISARGDLGYNDPPNNEQGSGFTWTKAPSFISPEGRSVLFDAGLMIGTGPDHVVAAAPNASSNLLFDQDYRLLRPAHYVLEPDRAGALQEVECLFDDSAYDSLSQAKEVGVSVRSRSYAFGGNAANAVVHDYVIRHRQPDNGVAASDATAAGLYMDWDIGSSGAYNLAFVSALDSTIGETRRFDTGYPVVGVKIISPLPSGSSFNFYAMENDGSNGSVGVYNGYPQGDKWTTLTTPRPVAGPNDVSMICGLRGLPLASQDSVRITYVIGLGVDDSDLKRTIDNATVAWAGPDAVPISVGAPSELTFYPNPCNAPLHLRSPFLGAQTVRIIDVLGRTAYSGGFNGEEAILDLSILEPGAYRIVVVSNGKVASGALMVQ